MRKPDRSPTGRPGHLAPGVLVLVIVALVVSACATGSPLVPTPQSTDGLAGAPSAQPVPVGVRVPAIGIDETQMLALGITADGSAEVPQDFARVGWFENGGAPGGRGPTVLLGHVDSRAGPAVFYDLRDLAPGDPIEVPMSNGTGARYTVDRLEQVPKDEFPTFAVFGATADDVLRLVTCAGDFDRGARSYVDNLVVHASRV